MARWNNHKKGLSGININDPDAEAMFREIFGDAEDGEEREAGFEQEPSRLEEVEASDDTYIHIEPNEKGYEIHLSGNMDELLQMAFYIVKSIYDFMGREAGRTGRLAFLGLMAKRMKVLTEDAMKDAN